MIGLLRNSAHTDWLTQPISALKGDPFTEDAVITNFMRHGEPNAEIPSVSNPSNPGVACTTLRIQEGGGSLSSGY